MILVDTVLKKREKNGNPIRVGIIGAGAMSRGLINQITNYTPGMLVVATFNRSLEKPKNLYKDVGLDDYIIAETKTDFQNAIDSKTPIITQNIDFLIESDSIDILVDMTGSIHFSTKLAIDAFNNKKDLLSFNAELDATIGPLLKYKADKAGVNYSIADGDQPGVTINLYRFVKSMGFKPLLCGNIKGLQDHYRNPTTQKSFAAQWEMTPEMVTSFADGTKMSIEQACIANATGMKVAQRGMYGYYTDKHIDDIKDLYDLEELKELGGIVDYVVGAKPGPGVYIYATTEDPISAKYLKYGKLGEGPLYSFYTPYHLLFFEMPNSIVRMVDFNDTIITAKSGPVVEVIAVAKIDLKKGDLIDGMGGYKTFGTSENTDISRKENLLPMGLAEGCTVIKDVPKDQVLTFDDVEFPQGRQIDALWEEQFNLFK